MTTTHETMTAETMTDAARRGQEAFTGALQIWAQSVERFMPTSDAKLRGVVEVVDNVFDFYDHMLASQREFTKSLLAVTTSVATKAGSAAEGAAKDVKNVVKEAVPHRDMHDGARDAAQ